MQSKKEMFLQMRPFRWFTALSCCGWIIFATGCALTEPESPEKIVAQRAEQRWNAIIAGDWETAYSYASPAYRDTVKLMGFIGQISGPVLRKSAEILSVECAESSCNVIVRMTSEPIQPGFGESQTDFTEKWVEQDGRWYHYQRIR